MAGPVEQMGLPKVLTGQTDVPAAGTAQPLLGTHYATGTVASPVGGKIFLGAGGAAFNTGAVEKGMSIITAGGNHYRITNVIDQTHIEVDGVVLTESNITTGVAYRIYKRPRSSWVIVGCKNAGTGPIWLGPRGGVSSTLGIEIPKNSTLPALNIDLSQADLWIDAGANGDDATWMVIG